MSALSQELLDEIVDYLAGDIDSLRSIARTCRAFAPRAQKHLLRRIRLTPDTATLERVARDFDWSTATAYVEELILDFDYCFEPAVDADVGTVGPIFGCVKVVELRNLTALGTKNTISKTFVIYTPIWLICLWCLAWCSTS